MSIFPATTDAEIKLAQVPHNLFVSALFLFDLLLTPAVIVLNIGMAGLLIPLTLSSLVLAYIYRRSRQSTTWFVDAHWRLAWLHGKWLLIGYAISSVLMLLAFLISSLSSHNMQHILWTALTRVALMPTLIAVMVTAVTGASAISLTTRRDVPEKILKHFPPPAP